MPSDTIVFEGEFVTAQEKDYVHLPFIVPPDTTQLEVEYRYSHQIDPDPLLSGGNTIDLGIFDARGIDFLNAGFRGWSGSERASFFINETEATPGYLAGPLLPGHWHVLLGLYKIAPEGCRYRVAVTLVTESGYKPRTDVAVSIGELPSSSRAVREGQWLRGEMHCHTVHSDGDSTITTLLQMARERGLDFLAITDHNTLSHQLELETIADPGLILIRGVEVTTFKGHFNVWGIPDWIDFRVTCPEEMRRAIESANAHGALTSCNHPKPFGPMWDYTDVEDYHCIEVWNGPWYVRNQNSLDFWTRRLAPGKRIVAVGGSDWHHFSELEQVPPRAPGTPTVWVHVPDTSNAARILQSIRKGHVSLSNEPEGPFLELRAGPDFSAQAGDVLEHEPHAELPVQVRCLRGMGHTLTLLDQNQILFTQRLTEPDQTFNVSLRTSQSLFVRAELRSTDSEMQALTNPIYFEAVR